jgi:autotransporter-associated beta strand protein
MRKNPMGRSSVLLAAALLAVGSAQAQTNFYWTNSATAVTSAWSSASWTNAVPASGGGTNYVLNFLANTGVYGASNDLGASFALNRLNIGGGTVTLLGNALVFTNSGATMPLLTNYSTHAAVINNNLTFATNFTVGVATTSPLTLAGVLSGSRLLTKTGAGALTLSGANNFTGGLTLSAGTLNLNNATALGTSAGTFSISGGTLDNTSGADITNSANNPMAWNGSFTFTGTTNLHLGTGAVNLSGTRTVTVSANTLTVGGALTNTGALIKSGAGTLVLGGAGTYTGLTTINAGTLRTTTSANRILSGNNLTFAGAGVLDLNQAQTLGVLTINAGASGALITNSSGTARALTLGVLAVNDDVTIGNAGSAFLTLRSAATGGDYTWTVASGKTLTLNAALTQGLAGGAGSHVNIMNSGTIASVANLANISGILGGAWLTYGSNDWATLAGGNVVALGAGGSSYDSFTTPGANRNILAQDANETVAASTTNNTLKIANTAAGFSTTIGDNQTLSLTAGGVLFTGSQDYTIAGGALRSVGASASDLLVYQYGAGNLTINSAIADGNGASTLTKVGTGVLTLAGTNTYTGGTLVRSGALALGINNALPTNSTLTLGSNPGSGTLNLGNYSQRLTALVAAGTNSNNAITLGAGQTLTVTGNVTVGSASTAGLGANTLLTITGAGSTVTAGSGFGTLYVGNDGSGVGAQLGTLNLTGLGAFTANYGIISVGVGSRAAGTLQLAATNKLTAATLSVGDSNGNSMTGLLFLGQTNVFNVGTINVGRQKATTGLLAFTNLFANPVLRIRGQGGTDVDRATLNIGDFSAQNGSGSANNGLVDFSGGTVDAMLGTLTIGKGQQLSGSQSANGTLIFSNGTIDVTGIVLGSTTGTSAGNAAANGTFNMTGGNLSVGAGGMVLGAQTNVSVGTGVFTLTGGMATLGAAIISSNGVSTFTLDGGTLNMQGNAIGSALPANAIDNLSFKSGTLQNSGEINGGAGLLKTGPGTLTLAGVNTYTGGTTVSNGTLRVNGSVGGLITVHGGGTLGGTGQVSSARLNPGSTLSPGNSPGLLLVTNLALNNNTNLFELVSAGVYDQVQVAGGGSLSLTNSPFLRLSLTGLVAHGGDKFLLFDNQFSATPFDKAADGNFRLLDEYYGLGSPLELTNAMTFFALGGSGATNEFQIFYDAAGVNPNGSGNDILLSVIPEPASLNLLALLGAAYWLSRYLTRSRRRDHC